MYLICDSNVGNSSVHGESGIERSLYRLVTFWAMFVYVVS